jgi:hypothetical protein
MTNNVHHIRKAIQSIAEAIAGIEAELKRHSDGRGEVSSPAQLTALKNALLRMRVELESGQVSLSEVGVGRVIADSWPFDNRLGEMIAQAEQDYRRAGQG